MTLSESILATMINLVENGRVPDALVRRGIRRLCRQRLQGLNETSDPDTAARAFAQRMRTGPVAPVPEKANEQHYEVPPRFFELALGPNLKYSSCYWTNEARLLDQAEDEALRRTIEHAEIRDGMTILELGCGWGSLTLRMAKDFPNASITAVSNSAPQRQFIESEAKARGLTNITVITADMNDFTIDRRFDRIVSVEMFEHMRNYETLLERTAQWLQPDGRLFVHIFCHHLYPYQFETDGAANWMGRHFFTGGIMPNVNVFDHFTNHLEVSESWTWDGTHYEKTANAWLKNMDTHRDEILDLFAETYGAHDARRWFHRWRIFFMACAELFGYERGSQWCVGHYQLRHRHAESIPSDDAQRGAA